MKKIVIFALLKIVEIAFIVFIPYLIGLWNPLGLKNDYFWLIGLETLVLGIIIPLFIIAILAAFCCLNWEIANKIAGESSD